MRRYRQRLNNLITRHKCVHTAQKYDADCSQERSEESCAGHNAKCMPHRFHAAHSSRELTTLHRTVMPSDAQHAQPHPPTKASLAIANPSGV